jgi:PAS domain S-box-containing protein
VALRDISPEAEAASASRVLRSGGRRSSPSSAATLGADSGTPRSSSSSARLRDGVPLMARGRRLGVPRSASPSRAASTCRRPRSLPSSRTAALALDNAYLYRQAEDARRERSADRRVLFAVTAALSDAITPAAVLRVLASEVVAAAGAATGMVSVRSGVGGHLETVRSTGYLDAQLARFRVFELESDLPIAKAVREKLPIFLESEARFFEYSREFAASCAAVGERSYAAIPLFLEGRVLGAVGFGFAEAHAFPEDEKAFLLALVQQGAQALERARLSALQTEEAMHLSHEVLKQMPEAILVTDLEGNIRQWLGEAESIFGYLAEEIIGKKLSALCREEDQRDVIPRILQHIEASRTFVGELPCERRDGSEVPIEVTAYAVHDSEGHPLFLVGILRDMPTGSAPRGARPPHPPRPRAPGRGRRPPLLLPRRGLDQLTTSLDLGHARTLAHLAVPLADCCVIDVPEGDSTKVAPRTPTTTRPPALRLLPRQPHRAGRPPRERIR